MQPPIMAEGADAAVRQLDPFKSSSLGSGRGKISDSDVRLLKQYRNARNELNASLALLEWSINLRERLEWGVLDIDEARAEVDAFNRAYAAHRRKRGRP